MEIGYLGGSIDKDGQKMRLFSYKMTNDSGFAPNPFFGIMTLATCKPKIRICKKEGDWIAGFTSKKLCCDKVGKERLVYLMQVKEKILIEDYYSGSKFQRKIPDLCRKEFVHKSGDNIYKPEGAGFIQLKNPNHGPKEHKHDLSGKYVLVSTTFFYFGRSPLEIPDSLRPEVPKGQSAHGSLTHDTERAAEFIKYITENYRIGVHNAPHTWPDDDDSWKFQ